MDDPAKVAPLISSTLAATGCVYFQRPGEQPVAVEHRFQRKLESTEQHFGPRECTATAQHTPLPYGWVEKASCVVVQNVEGAGRHTQPTQEQREDNEKRVVMLYVDDSPMCYLHPGQTQVIFNPAGVVSARCCYKTAKCFVTVLPC